MHTLAEGVGDVEQKEARASHRWNTSGACPLTAARTERIGVSADAVILCLYVFLRLAAMPHGCNCRGTYRASHRRDRGAALGTSGFPSGRDTGKGEVLRGGRLWHAENLFPRSNLELRVTDSHEKRASAVIPPVVDQIPLAMLWRKVRLLCLSRARRARFLPLAST